MALIPDAIAAARYGRSVKTLKRWEQALGFPAPVTIRKRRYRDTHALAAFDARMVSMAEDAAA